MSARPDPRGPDELKAARSLEAVWAANAARIAAAARAKAAAAFWAAVEAKRGAAPPEELNNNGGELPKLRLASRRGTGA